MMSCGITGQSDLIGLSCDTNGAPPPRSGEGVAPLKHF